MSYLIDTNVISELVRQNPNKNVLAWFSKIPDDALHISVLTLGEIRKGIEKIKEEERKERLRLWLEHKLPAWFNGRILSIDQHVADRWGRLQFHAGRPLPAIDSLLAATSLHYDLRIVTRNEQDFNFPPLEVINPWLN
jgi:predicted nucleic acid-binding protein